MSLFFQEIVNHLVLAEVREDERDMHPVGALVVVLPYQLVEGQVLLDVVEPPLPLLNVTVYAEVGGLALHVLRVIDTAHRFVQLLTAESAAYLDGLVHRLPQRFQDVCAQIHQVDHLLHVGFVVDTFRLRCRAGVHFLNGEVHSYRGPHKPLVVVVVLANFNVCVTFRDMKFHSCHDGLEAKGQGWEQYQFTDGCQNRAVYLATRWHQEARNNKDDADCEADHETPLAEGTLLLHFVFAVNVAHIRIGLLPYAQKCEWGLPSVPLGDFRHDSA